MIEIDCPRCDGRGYLEHQVRVDHFKREKCDRCDGLGVVEKEEMKTLEEVIGDKEHWKKLAQDLGEALGKQRIEYSAAIANAKELLEKARGYLDPSPVIQGKIDAFLDKEKP